MSKRHKHKRRHDEDDEGGSARAGRSRRGPASHEDGLALQRSARGKRRRRFEASPQSEPAELDRPRAAITCWQCGHLIVTRSLVKHVSQSWDRAIAYPSLTCFQQRWTLEDPDSVPDHASVSEYLVGGAERCPDFIRGMPRNHDW